MLIRIRCPDGNFRYQLDPSDTADKLIDSLLKDTPNADPTTLTFSNDPRGGEMIASSLRGTTIGDLGLSHGHLLYAAYKSAQTNGDSTQPAASTSTSTIPAQGASKSISKPWENVVEDPVDVYWEAQEGKIPRDKDSKMCRHGAKAMCDYCMPLEPYDPAYHQENNIKHLSYHAYLRQKNASANKPGQSYIPPLEEASFTVQTPCPSGNHPAWPAGICTKCQPSAITLQRQPYRMVDHVEFAHSHLIEDLLTFWRKTQSQRFGFLLGRYEPYHDVPMGIKAVVEAIHEPPQQGEIDGITLGLPWEDQERVVNLANECGLQVVGMIYSDLTPIDPEKEPEKVGQVLCKRHKDSFFLSGCEVMFSSKIQAGKPNPSRFSMSGKFNSKFVTCVLTGEPDGGIDVAAYQISEQGMAVVNADMAEASVNPNVIRVKKSEGERYVPDVFFRYKNEYNIEVKESAKPTFPVEYLLVNVTHGFPKEAKPLFRSWSFAIENRQGLHDQNLQSFLSSVNQVVGHRILVPLGEASGSNGKGKGKAEDDLHEVRQKLVDLLSDWHLLCFLQTSGFTEADDMTVLCRIATTHDAGEALDALLVRPAWQTLSAIAAESAGESGGSTLGGGGGAMTEDEELSRALAASMEGQGQGSSNQSSSAPASAPETAPASRATSSRRVAPAVAAAQARAAAREARGPVDESKYIYTGSDDDDVMMDSDEDQFEEGNDEEDDGVYDDFQDADSDMDDEPKAFSFSAFARNNQAAAANAAAAAASSSAQHMQARAPIAAPAPPQPPIQRAPQQQQPPPPQVQPQAQANDGVVSCQHCTFDNPIGNADCEVCGLPL